jgi:excisionase family DNA binding protein
MNSDIHHNGRGIEIDGDRYVFTATAAALSGVSKDYISRLCRQGKLKARSFAGQWLVNLSSLEDFLSHRDRKAL